MRMREALNMRKTEVEEDERGLAWLGCVPSGLD